jgi:hypothetical protein
MSDVHATAGMLAFAATALFLVSAAIAAVLDRWHEGARILAGVVLGAFVVQSGIGLLLLVGGEEPRDGLHVLYAVALVAVIPLALTFASEAPRRSRSAVLAVAATASLLLAWRLLVTG